MKETIFNQEETLFRVMVGIVVVVGFATVITTLVGVAARVLVRVIVLRVVVLLMRVVVIVSMVVWVLESLSGSIGISNSLSIVGNSTGDTSVDSLGDGIDVTLVSVFVEVISVPVPSSSLESILRSSNKAWVVNKINTKSLASSSVVGVTSELESTSTLIGGTIGSAHFSHVVELASFFSDLSEESGLSGGGVDVILFHSLVHVGKIGG